MKIRTALTVVFLLGLLASCSLPHTDLKSPCVGIEGSPCGPRKPVNDWWLNDNA